MEHSCAASAGNGSWASSPHGTSGPIARPFRDSSRHMCASPSRFQTMFKGRLWRAPPGKFFPHPRAQMNFKLFGIRRVRRS
eukprot:2295691-Alexandrium_andersonii.AAC.1